ncbi:unnamed protein product [Effrenium voratum]|uniref:Uncharacterized protein n=1 Tax=Effrenium voratum TaxID=2562239 RepID=A0AA36JA01_9DINO|nr:unnamed protein product [Effrenium voratum]
MRPSATAVCERHRLLRERVQDALVVSKTLEPLPSLAVILPALRRAHGAEEAYLQRSAWALRRELRPAEVLVFGDARPAGLAMRELEGLPVRFKQRPEHKELQRPESLRRAFGDPLEKVLWRSRLVLDFVSAVKELDAPGAHVLWLEDDVELLPGFGTLLEGWLQEHGRKKDWLCLQLLGFQRDTDPKTWTWGTRGWGGGGSLLYNAAWLPRYREFLAASFDKAPLDWLHKMMPTEGKEWWQPKLQPVLLKHFGEHSSHEDFL